MGPESNPPSFGLGKLVSVEKSDASDDPTSNARGQHAEGLATAKALDRLSRMLGSQDAAASLAADIPDTPDVLHVSDAPYVSDVPDIQDIQDIPNIPDIPGVNDELADVEAHAQRRLESEISSVRAETSQTLANELEAAEAQAVEHRKRAAEKAKSIVELDSAQALEDSLSRAASEQRLRAEISILESDRTATSGPDTPPPDIDESCLVVFRSRRRSDAGAVR